MVSDTDRLQRLYTPPISTKRHFPFERKLEITYRFLRNQQVLFTLIVRSSGIQAKCVPIARLDWTAQEIAIELRSAACPLRFHNARASTKEPIKCVEGKPKHPKCVNHVP